MDNTEQLTHISLCTGYGGIDLGLGRVLPSLRTIAYCELEAFTCANLVSKIEAGCLGAAPIWTDLKTFPWTSFRERVDILSGGFPCQPFSSAGRRAGDEDPRHLWPYIVRGIRLCRPAIVFFENVMGIISSKLKSDEWRDRANTPVLLHILRELERLGYKAEAGIFSAAEVGAPHQRKRVFILGCRSDLIERAREIIDVDHTSSSSRERSRAPIHEEWPDMDRRGQSIQTKRDASNAYITASSDAWPASRGKPQYAWEPPRTLMDNSMRSRWRKEQSDTSSNPEEGSFNSSKRLSHDSDQEQRERGDQSEMGRGSDGSASRLGYADLCISTDHRSHELRALGNGVVPATAERAFVTLFNRL